MKLALNCCHPPCSLCMKACEYFCFIILSSFAKHRPSSRETVGALMVSQDDHVCLVGQHGRLFLICTEGQITPLKFVCRIRLPYLFAAVFIPWKPYLFWREILEILLFSSRNLVRFSTRWYTPPLFRSKISIKYELQTSSIRVFLTMTILSR